MVAAFSGEGEGKVLACEPQWAKATDLREEQVEWFEGEGREQSVQLGQACEEVRCEEDEKMEVDGEVDSKKKLDRRKREREMIKQLRRAVDFACLCCAKRARAAGH